MWQVRACGGKSMQVGASHGELSELGVSESKARGGRVSNAAQKLSDIAAREVALPLPAYRDFIRNKSQMDAGDGFEPVFMPDFLFDFQKLLTEWAVRTGRAAMFADCGMGKTAMQLVWAENVVRKTNKPVLVLAPLSVSMQTLEEAEKFGIDTVRSMTGKISGTRIVLTNYERLHHFNHSDFAGVVCDESSIIKNFDGARKGEITEFMKKVRYRLLCTATAAPNDYIEFGTSSEALGYLGFMDMLGTFFKNDEDSLHPAFIGSKWRFKRHAEQRFWRWTASWARACRKPSDLGFDDGKFILPSLTVREHVVDSPSRDGDLFNVPAVSLLEQREDTRITIDARCAKAAELLRDAPSGIAWCHLNKEADTLAKMISGAVQIGGSDDDDRKEEVFSAFRKGQIRVICTKPKIAAFGMNWQHCSHMTYFPTHSFEQYYQAVRRCWRFGQTKPVMVDAITTTSQSGVMGNLKRKADACDAMFGELVGEMNNAVKIARMTTFNKTQEVPGWL